jgi:4-hydroxy-tetrahydrodipicolinate synthase
MPIDANETTGVGGILPPIPTPLRGGQLDITSLERELEYLYDSVDGFLVGGSTGEAASLTVGEREAVVRTVARRLEGERVLAVSIADNSIENSRRLSEVAGECNADLLVVSCPNYFHNEQQMLEAYLVAIAGFASADLCLYDNPVASNTSLGVAQILDLLAVVPRLTHVKMTDPALGKVAALREKSEVVIFSGDDSVLWHQLAGGADGVMTAVPLVFPERTRRMWRAFRDGSLDAAYEEYEGLAPFIHVGLSGHDYPSVVKAVLHHERVLDSPEVRLPLLPLTEERRAEIMIAYSRSCASADARA